MAEYIEKEALVHHFMTKRQYLTKDLVMDAAYEVSKFPAADVVPVVHGRWVREEDDVLRCQRCNSEPLLDDYGFWVKSCYCPKCGARMDGE